MCPLKIVQTIPCHVHTKPTISSTKSNEQTNKQTNEKVYENVCEYNKYDSMKTQK